MARRNANLAGLAALGALGYKLASSGNKKASGSTAESKSDALMELADDQYNPDVRYGGSADMGDELGTRRNLETGEYYSTAMSAKRPSGPGGSKSNSKTKVIGDDQYNPDVRQGRIAGQGGPRGTRYLPVTDTGDETERLARRYPAPAAKRTREELIGAIPTDEGKYAPVSGQRVTGNETTRNLSNIMNATAGLSFPGYVGKMTQAQYNARAAARRAAGELTPAEIEAAKEAAQAAREAKTLNPNAWMAGPKGMMENFKKGGAVKAKKMVVTKMGGKVSSASKRADGIATKGKTRGKLY